MNWVERLALWLFGKQPVKHIPISDNKVASNDHLLKLLGFEDVTGHFFDSMIAHIRENGLTFRERDFVTEVIDRIPMATGGTKQDKASHEREAICVFLSNPDLFNISPAIVERIRRGDHHPALEGAE